MKKVLLLGTLICAGQLYGMDPTSLYELRRTGPLYPKRGMGVFEELPQDVHNEIVKKAIESSDTLYEAIEAIKVASALQGVRYNNLKDFTKLVHILADKFEKSTEIVANKFNTPVAKRYWKLYLEFLQILTDKSIDILALKNIIRQGVDIDGRFSSLWSYMSSIEPNNSTLSPEIIKLLLENGANPYAISGKGSTETALDYLNKHFQDTPEYEQIKELLEKAMQQQNPPSH